MAEILAGTSPGIPIGEMVAVLADDFGYRPDNTRFKAHCIRNINRAYHDIWLDYPRIRRQIVCDADVTIVSGVSMYDVAETVENGGWGWDRCVEILSIVLPAQQTPQLELIQLHQWRERQDYLVPAGPPMSAVLIDHRRVRIVPEPNYNDATGKGDYLQATPQITADGDRISWPPAADQVVLLGAEFYLSLSYRTDLADRRERAYEKAREKLRTGEIDGGPMVKFAIVARNFMRRRGRPPNDQDRGRSQW